MCRPVSGRPARARTDAAARRPSARGPRSDPGPPGRAARVAGPRARRARPSAARRAISRTCSDAVGHDRGPLGEGPAQLIGRLEGAVEDDLRARHAGPAGDAVLEARGHLGPAARPVQAGHHAQQGVRLDRVGDRRVAAPATAWNAARLGLDSRAVEHVERGAEALGQLRRRPAGRAGVERRRITRDRGPGPSRRGHTRRPTRVTSSRCGYPEAITRSTPARAVLVEQPRDARVASPPARCPHRRARRGCPAHSPGDDPALVVGRERVHARLADAVEPRVLGRAIAGDLGPREQLAGRVAAPRRSPRGR